MNSINGDLIVFNHSFKMISSKLGECFTRCIILYDTSYRDYNIATTMYQ